MDAEIHKIAEEVNARLRLGALTIATAESCTGGAIAAAITSVAGSSDVFKGSVVAYSNDVKHRVLGVAQEILDSEGAVSAATVEAMAVGVQRLIGSHCAVATSGIAGPGGAVPGKPVGTVWVAIVVGDKRIVRLLTLQDKGRENNICTTVKNVLSLLLKEI
ncbi:MAG: CinA family protein [Bacteroidaceae bacterium]|nr:CinA family protein [Bacteroidaceae bacterium]